VGCTHLSEKDLNQQRLLKARKLMEAGDYKAALKRYRMLRTAASDSVGDQALYQIGLIYCHPDNPDRDLSKALDSFRTITSDYRQSALTLEADIWTANIEEYQHKKTQITKLFKKYGTLEKTMAQKDIQIDSLNSEMNQMRSHIESLQKKLEELKAQIESFKQIDLGIDAKKREAAPERLIEEEKDE
jgi:hypothetical protein